jgi:protein-arginine kinase activator protein McsA
MALPQRDKMIEEIKRLDALLEYAVMHDEVEEAERIREQLQSVTE